MANTTQYAQLNIGRNVGNEPMSARDWDTFRIQSRDALAYAASYEGTVMDHMVHARNAVQFHHGTGMWDGVPEDAAHVSLYWPGGIDVSVLREQAAGLASVFGQDAIALIVGSELVTP